MSTLPCNCAVHVQQSPGRGGQASCCTTTMRCHPALRAVHVQQLCDTSTRHFIHCMYMWGNPKHADSSRTTLLTQTHSPPCGERICNQQQLYLCPCQLRSDQPCFCICSAGGTCLQRRQTAKHHLPGTLRGKLCRHAACLQQPLWCPILTTPSSRIHQQWPSFSTITDRSNLLSHAIDVELTQTTLTCHGSATIIQHR